MKPKEEIEEKSGIQRIDKAAGLPIVIFFILAYALFWGLNYLYAWIFGDASSFIDLTSFIGVLYYIVFLIPSFAPFIAAVIVTAIFDKKEGLRKFSKRLVKFKVKIHWYILAILIPISAYIIPKLIRYLINDPSQVPFMEPSSWNLGSLVIANVIMSGIVEEPGWRNYAVPKLNKLFNPLVTSTIVGILWACWHLIFYISGARPMSQFPQFVLTVVLLSIIYTWLYIKTESAPIVIIFHIIHNFSVFLFLDVEITFLSGGSIPYLIIVVLIIILYGPSLQGGLISRKKLQRKLEESEPETTSEE